MRDKAMSALPPQSDIGVDEGIYAMGQFRTSVWKDCRSAFTTRALLEPDQSEGGVDAVQCNWTECATGFRIRAANCDARQRAAAVGTRLLRLARPSP